jgi:hypothetical protein
MAGLRAEQIANYNKDFYKYEREGYMAKEAVYKKVYKVINNAVGAGDKFTQKLGAADLMEQTVEGQDIDFTSPVDGWTTYTKYATFNRGLKYTSQAVEDAIKFKDLIKSDAASWGEKVYMLKETKAARPFNYGGAVLGDDIFNGSFVGNTDPSGKKLYDGVCLFNLSGNLRTTKAGLTYYNSVASAYSTGAITDSHFSTLWNLMTGLNNKNEEGLPINNKPDTVLCKTSDYDSIWKILNSDQLAGSPNNDKNVHKGRIKNIIEWDFLTEDAFYVGKANDDKITFEERKMPSINFFRDPYNNGYCATIECRFGIHFRPGSWRNWVRGGGTSA